MKNQTTKHVCKDCRGTAIHVRAWVDMNNLEYVSDIDHDGEVWCDTCQDHVSTVQLQTIVTLFNLEEEKMEQFTVPQMVEMTNVNGLCTGDDCTVENWQSGWDKFCEGDIYKLLTVKWEVMK